MTPACIDFGRRILSGLSLAGMDVLELGAFNVNGSIKDLVLGQGPRSYVGTDMRAGPNVDRVMDAGDAAAVFGPASFDVVVTTEMLEHVEDWRAVCGAIRDVVKPGGLLILTTRSPGFPRHDYPGDYWRYTPEQIVACFPDFDPLDVDEDRGEPGVFLFARRSGRPATDLALVPDPDRAP